MEPPTLYLIAEKGQFERDHGTVHSLQRACKQLGVPYDQIVVGDLALADIAGMQFTQGSLLYRANISPKASIIESMLVTLHPGTFTTIHYPKTSPQAENTYQELCEQIARGLCVIPTLIVDDTWQRMDTATLEGRIAGIGGFPVVLKQLGLSHGQGVRKLDTVGDLQKFLQAATFGRDGMIVRQYLADYRHYRLIVVDGEVVAAIEYHKPTDDFRTNATKTPVVTALTVAELPAELIQLALDGVALHSSILGGVDILVDQRSQVAYLAEVNVPCYYPRAEGPTGVDISGKLLTALVRKRGE